MDAAQILRICGLIFGGIVGGLTGGVGAPALANDTMDVLLAGGRVVIEGPGAKRRVVTFTADAGSSTTGRFLSSEGHEGLWTLSGDTLCTARDRGGASKVGDEENDKDKNKENGQDADKQIKGCGVLPSGLRLGSELTVKDHEKNAVVVRLEAAQ